MRTIRDDPGGMEVYDLAKRILVAVIFVPLLFMVLLWLPSVVWAVVVAGISALATFELLRATGGGKVSFLMQAAAIVSAALIPLCHSNGSSMMAVTLCSFSMAAVAFLEAIRSYDGKRAHMGLFQVLLTLFGGILMPMALSALVALKGMEHGQYLTLLAMLLAFATDAGAYFAGVFLGRHRGITKVSPNKSLEGYIGGFLTGIIFAVVYGLIVSYTAGLEANYLSLALCGLFGALATELGDLAFSFVKREYGVKDFGHLLPGHGGMLDRFDSMIFCGPVVLFIVRLLPAF